MNELDLLKIRLKNAIDGHKICMADDIDMLILLEDCYSVISRIKPIEEKGTKGGAE